MTFLKAPLYLLAAMILSLWRSQAFQAPKIRCLRSWVDKESPRIKIKRVATTWPPARFSTPVDNSSPTEDSDESLAEFTVSKEQVSQLYELGQYVFAAMGVLLLLMPDRTMTTLLATKCGGAAGFLMAAGLSYILVGANEHDRLGSDTYKRLNVGLLGFSVLGLLAIPGEAGFFPTAVPAFILSGLVTVVRLYGVTAAYVGWSRGVDKNETMKFKPKKLLRELYKGTIETVKGLRVQTAKKALTYRNCLLLVGVGIFSSFMEWIFDLRYRVAFNRTWFEISLQWSAIARLFMVTTMIYSLKDAAERDRLTGTTFIQLNLMVGAWAALVGLGQSVYPLGFNLSRGIEMFAFSLPFFIKAYKSQKEKDDKKSAPAN